MKVYIAKHYWKEGENATWEVHEKVDRELFSYLKKSYQTFVQEKPKMINKDRWFIYLCYDETKDAFDRSITNITFFISKKKLELNFCQCKYEDLEYEVSDKNMWIMLVGGVILLAALYFVKHLNEGATPIENGQFSSQEEVNTTKVKEVVLPKDNNTTANIEINSSKNSEKEKKTQEKKEQNLELKDLIKNTPKDVKPMLKDKQVWINKENNCSINRIDSLYSKYITLFHDGISVTIILFNQKNEIIDINYKKSQINKNKIDKQKIIFEDKYEIHLVSNSFYNEEIINGNITINKDDLISILNQEKVKKKIDEGYYIKIEKFKGDKDEEKSKSKKIFGIGFLLLVLGGVGFFISNPQLFNKTQEEHFSKHTKQDYTQFINDWNQQVQKNTSNKQFLLSRDSNDDLIEQLNEWMKNFYIPEITDSEKYNDFLEKNKFGKRTSFDTDMSGDDIRNKLKDVTNEKVVSGIVKKVLMMNDMEFWNENKK